MKKFNLILNLFCVLSILTACSSDDDSSNENVLEISMDVNGETKIFDRVEITPQFFEENGVEHVRKHISANITSDVDSIYFYVEDENLGSNVVQEFYYTIDGVTYDEDENTTFTANVTKNTNTELQMTFSGTLRGFNINTSEFENVTITNGIVNIKINNINGVN